MRPTFKQTVVGLAGLAFCLAMVIPTIAAGTATAAVVEIVWKGIFQ